MLDFGICVEAFCNYTHACALFTEGKRSGKKLTVEFVSRSALTAVHTFVTCLQMKEKEVVRNRDHLKLLERHPFC